MSEYNWNNAEFQKEVSELAARCAERDAPVVKDYFDGIESEFTNLMAALDAAYARHDGTYGDIERLVHAKSALRDFVWHLCNHPDAQDT